MKHAHMLKHIDVDGHHVTATELQRAITKRIHRDVLGHRIVLTSCYGKIKRVAGIDGTSCIYEVPEFVIGVPPYDLSKAVSHVIASLERNGYEVAYMFPRALLISWDVKAGSVSLPLALHAPSAQSCQSPLPPSSLPQPPVPVHSCLLPPPAQSCLLPPPAQPPLPLPAQARAFRPISEFNPTSRFGQGLRLRSAS